MAGDFSGIATAGTSVVSNAQVSLYAANRFITSPAFNSLPPGVADYGPVTSGIAFGSPGAYTLTGVADGDYYILTQFQGVNNWVGPVSSVNYADINTGSPGAGLADNNIFTGENTFEDNLTVLGGSAVALSIATPSILSITAFGANDGGTTYQYYVVAVNNQSQDTIPSTISSFAGNTALSSSNYNIITSSTVTGAGSYRLLKPNGSGGYLLLTTQTSPVFNDKGAFTPTAYSTPALVNPGGNLLVQTTPQTTTTGPPWTPGQYGYIVPDTAGNLWVSNSGSQWNKITGSGGGNGNVIFSASLGTLPTTTPSTGGQLAVNTLTGELWVASATLQWEANGAIGTLNQDIHGSLAGSVFSQLGTNNLGGPIFNQLTSQSGLLTSQQGQITTLQGYLGDYPDTQTTPTGIVPQFRWAGNSNGPIYSSANNSKAANTVTFQRFTNNVLNIVAGAGSNATNTSIGITAGSIANGSFALWIGGSTGSTARVNWIAIGY